MSGPAVIPGVAAPIAGWYGKIPALGDFASRRLPSSFVDTWDAWLQRTLAASRAALRERWQEFYLTSPVWRFALFPGVCGDSGWVGIMMPSVDKVGRNFPLTIALALDPHPEMIATVFAAQDWFAAVEQIALSSLSLDFPVDELENRLLETPFGGYPTPDRQGDAAARELAGWWATPGPAPVVLDLPGPDAMTSVLTASGLNMLSASAYGKSLWWARDELAGDSQLHGFSGLPPEDHFATMLAGVASGPEPL